MVSGGNGAGNSGEAAPAPVAAAANHAQIAMGVARRILALISLGPLTHCCLYFTARACTAVADSRSCIPLYPSHFFCGRPRSSDPVYVNCPELNTVTRCPAFPLCQRVYCPHECGATRLS